jgi:hypothetical protein
LVGVCVCVCVCLCLWVLKFKIKILFLMWWFFRLHTEDSTTYFSGFFYLHLGSQIFACEIIQLFLLFGFSFSFLAQSALGRCPSLLEIGVWWKYNQVFMQTFETKSPSCHCDFKYHFGVRTGRGGPYKSTIRMTPTFVFESDFPPVCQGYRWEPPTLKYSKQTYCPCVNHEWVPHTIPYNHTSIQRAWHMIGYHKVENFQCW